ncbi:hypothetical protein F0919_17975 [Taibaiella lutea]|uniref:ParB/Sulfiredoxin domain-containing protein n=1 Tax=Taibaiella lutea TaxID=2608001 RepID=A0A5M6CHV2_9BACT|nr:hypothetical protein [Taibaiella lutea]KAA5532669.1 hypothetical protein F0919_17975 [Taibaiella lutea]
MKNKNTIKSRIIRTENINWKQLKFIQQDGFKEHTAVNKSKLKESLVANGFADAFNVWQDENNDIWCLDGYHRKHDLEELECEGISVPEKLPALFIDCNDKAEAAALVLVFSSRYAKITLEGMQAFMNIYDLQINSEIFNSINLSEIEQFEMLQTLPIPEELTAVGKEKPATIKITFSNPRQLEAAMPMISSLLEEFPESFYSVSCGEI